MKPKGSIDKADLTKYLAGYYARYRKREGALQREAPVLAASYRMDAITYQCLIADVVHDAI